MYCRRSIQAEVDGADWKPRGVLPCLNEDHSPLSAEETEQHVTCCRGFGVQPRISSGNQSVEMKTVQAYDLLSAAHIRLPTQLQVRRVLCNRDPTMVLLLIVVAQNPSAQRGAVRDDFDALDERAHAEERE
jgi:hypothetical protein